MTPSSAVHATSHYRRLSTKLHKSQRDFESTELSAVAILAADPHNRSRRHNIRKLEDVPPGEGQYRLSLGRSSFRYDIIGQAVLLSYCGLRREDTYRKQIDIPCLPWHLSARRTGVEASLKRALPNPQNTGA
jgi:hypothetical protein